MFQKDKQKVLPIFDVNNRTTNPTPPHVFTRRAGPSPAEPKVPSQHHRHNTNSLQTQTQQHNGLTDTSRPLRQEARSLLQYRRCARTVRSPPNQFPPRKSANSSSTPIPNLHHFAILIPRNRTARNSRPLEVLGTYDPKPQAPRPGDTHGRPWKDIRLDISRARYWVGVGAQPSDTAWRLLSMVGILEPQFRVGQVLGKVVKADSAAKSLIREGGNEEEGGEAKL
jgi:small subunit ribosomal protein S16